jgi:large subunit ribosomal protein L25
MANALSIDAELRNDLGKGASRRLRRNADLVPGIIYGAGKDPQPLTLVRKDLEKALENEAFFSQVVAVNVAGDVQKAILKDLQRHPAKERVMHADFMRIDENVKLKVNTQIHLVGEANSPGVKEGGVLDQQATEVEILCLPTDIPEYLEVDVSGLEMGDNIHLSDITLPAGVESTALALGEDHDVLIVAVVAPRAAVEEETEDEAAPEAADVPTVDEDEAGDEAEGDGED